MVKLFCFIYVAGHRIIIELFLRRTLVLKNRFQQSAVRFQNYYLIAMLMADTRLLKTVLNVQVSDTTGAK
ncbi:hypothetical protein BH11BAC6_BH11BAC6_11930 [soil metagenome]